MPVKIHDKSYRTVAERINEFRHEYPHYTIETQLIKADEGMVVMKALIMNGDVLIATGYAEEERGSSNINKTSALENAETSAVGRALAFFGLAGTEIASADEVATAITQQKEKELHARAATHMQAVLANLDSIQAIKGFLAEDNLHAALEAWRELGEETMRALWVAPSKGGVFTTRERAQLDKAATEDYQQRETS